MDVQCERCKTEYEFDDALVSGRGTTVRCTHCGHQFKVRRPDAADASADRWIVRTAIGQQLTFLTLRELQRAILAKQVTRHDTLLLAGTSPRPLGSITELEPFFDGRASSRPPPAAADNVGHAVPVPPSPPPPPPRRPNSFAGPPEEPFVPAGASLPAPSLESPRSASLNREPPPPRAGGAFTAPYGAPSPVPDSVAPFGQGQYPHMVQAPPTMPAPLLESPEALPPLPPPTVPVRRSADADFHQMDAAYPPHSSDDAFDIPRRRSVGGWVVAFVLLLAVGVVGWVVAKPYLVARSGGGSPPLGSRAQTFVEEGERAMSDGDLDAAQQDFDKASVLAERDPRVLLDAARVAAAKADIPWLKLLLLPTEATDDVRATKAELDERLARARSTADEAAAAAPDDPAVVRAEIDALRLRGERDIARRDVPKMSVLTSQPETAYVLAALDLAEPAPFWTTVVDRLRLASSGEAHAGRARAALVYALAKSGDLSGAKAELTKLDVQTRPYPSLRNLHAFVDKAPPKPGPDGGVAPNALRGDMSAALKPTAPAVNAGSGEGVPGEQAGAMQVASQAIKRGDYGRARRIYEALVTRNPNDSEALAGIGDVERAQGDTAGAIASYQRALNVNPSYLPALLGAADTEWASGDRAKAQRAYADIVDRFPEGSYPPLVKTRSEPPSAAAPPSPGPNTKPYDPGNGL